MTSLSTWSSSTFEYKGSDAWVFSQNHDNFDERFDDVGAAIVRARKFYLDDVQPLKTAWPVRGGIR